MGTIVHLHDGRQLELEADVIDLNIGDQRVPIMGELAYYLDGKLITTDEAKALLDGVRA